jgi:hypothetical protein
VQKRLTAQRQPAHDEVRVRVAGEQRRLKKYEARRPYGGRSSEPREDLLGDDRLNKEEQERTCENRQREKRHGRGPEGSPPLAPKGVSRRVAAANRAF